MNLMASQAVGDETIASLVFSVTLANGYLLIIWNIPVIGAP